MARSRTPNGPQQRQLLAETSARLMATDGITDYALAKRKAARQLGCDETRNLPTNEEVDEALRIYRGIYQRDSHPAVLQALRLKARELMRWLGGFEPYLTGSVLSGSAGEHSDINLLVLSDDPKEVEFFLLNARKEYRHIDCPHPEGVSMRWTEDEIPVVLSVLPRKQARYKAGSGAQQERARLDRLEQLLAETA